MALRAFGLAALKRPRLMAYSRFISTFAEARLREPIGSRRAKVWRCGKQFTMKARPGEGKDRPPPERVRRGEYRIADSEDAGGSYAIDLASCPIDAALTSGKLRLGSGNEGVRWEAAKAFRDLAPATGRIAITALVSGFLPQGLRRVRRRPRGRGRRKRAKAGAGVQALAGAGCGLLSPRANQ